MLTYTKLAYALVHLRDLKNQLWLNEIWKKKLMKFENILHIYWTKGIFICTKLYYFDDKLTNIVSISPGISTSFNKMVCKRFEMSNFIKNSKKSIIDQELIYDISLKRSINTIMSQILSVNNNISYLVRLRLIYQFLIKSYVGKCHAVGKPVRGQRTWSNAWTSYNRNNTLRMFISNTKKKTQVLNVKEKINFKLTKKRYGVKLNKTSLKIKQKKLSWF